MPYKQYFQIPPIFIGEKLKVRDHHNKQWLDGEVTRVDSEGSVSVYCRPDVMIITSKRSIETHIIRQDNRQPREQKQDIEIGDDVLYKSLFAEHWRKGKVSLKYPYAIAIEGKPGSINKTRVKKLVWPLLPNTPFYKGEKLKYKDRSGILCNGEVRCVTLNGGLEIISHTLAGEIEIIAKDRIEQDVVRLDFR